MEAERREADIDRAERQRESFAKLASQERIERDRLAIQNSKKIEVKRGSDTLHNRFRIGQKVLRMYQRCFQVLNSVDFEWFF